MNKSEEVGGKIHNLVEYLTARRHVDGTINTETPISAIAQEFNLGKETILKILKTYYTYTSGILYPRSRCFRPTDALFLREYRYQNSLTTKKHKPNKGNILIVLNTKTKTIEVKERRDYKPAMHNILATCSSPAHATKRYLELQKEQRA